MSNKSGSDFRAMIIIFDHDKLHAYYGNKTQSAFQLRLDSLNGRWTKSIGRWYLCVINLNCQWQISIENRQFFIIFHPILSAKDLNWFIPLKLWINNFLLSLLMIRSKCYDCLTTFIQFMCNCVSSWSIEVSSYD